MSFGRQWGENGLKVKKLPKKKSNCRIHTFLFTLRFWMSRCSIKWLIIGREIKYGTEITKAWSIFVYDELDSRGFESQVQKIFFELVYLKLISWWFCFRNCLREHRSKLKLFWAICVWSLENKYVKSELWIKYKKAYLYLEFGYRSKVIFLI